MLDQQLSPRTIKQLGANAKLARCQSRPAADEQNYDFPSSNTPSNKNGKTTITKKSGTSKTRLKSRETFLCYNPWLDRTSSGKVLPSLTARTEPYLTVQHSKHKNTTWQQYIFQTKSHFLFGVLSLSVIALILHSTYLGREGARNNDIFNLLKSVQGINLALCLVSNCDETVSVLLKGKRAALFNAE